MCSIVAVTVAAAVLATDSTADVHAVVQAAGATERMNAAAPIPAPEIGRRTSAEPRVPAVNVIVVETAVVTETVRAAPRCHAALVPSWISRWFTFCVAVALRSVMQPTFRLACELAPFGFCEDWHVVAAPAGAAPNPSARGIDIASAIPSPARTDFRFSIIGDPPVA